MKKSNSKFNPWVRILCIVLAAVLALGSVVAIIMEILGAHVH